MAAVSVAAADPSRLGLGGTLSRTPTQILVFLACDRGEDVEHHGVDRGEHPAGELVGRG